MSSDTRVRALKRRVLAYHARAGRGHLPWRKTRDPYRILVSEIMLQQTQADRVIPFYRRFLEHFPSVHALAQATLPEVLTLWSGLGYNRRAKFLHEAAKAIDTQHGGRVPRSCEALRALPGIGDYTAKAIRVFAWNEPEALIETNVRAVFLHQLFPARRKVSDSQLMPLIVEALPRKDARRWYAALMDYGTYLKATRPNPSRRSSHHVRQKRFSGSLREARGRILKAHLSGERLEQLREELGLRYQPALDSLRKDGLMPVRR